MYGSAAQRSSVIFLLCGALNFMASECHQRVITLCFACSYILLKCKAAQSVLVKHGELMYSCEVE
jgi:hypothetical protein